MRSIVGWKIEDDFGIFNPPSARTPVSSANLYIQKSVELDQGVRGIAAFDFASYAGPQHAAIEVGGMVYPTSIDSLVQGIMGSAEVIGGGTRYGLSTSVPSLSFQVQDLDITAGDDIQRYRGCLVNELQLSYSSESGVLVWSAGLLGQDMTWGAIAVDVIKWASSVEEWDAEEGHFKWSDGARWGPATGGGGSGGGWGAMPDLGSPFLGWSAAAKFGDPATLNKVTDVEIVLTRESALQFGNLYDAPSTIHSGLLGITCLITILWDSDSDLNRYLNKTQEEFEVTWTRGVHTLYFQAKNMDFGDGPVEIERTSTEIRLTYSARALYDADDAGPCIFEVTAS